jgi:DeoR/GlpR family transcriptional regulator of sugar metabolism
VVADASKFSRRSLALIGKIQCAQRIITDSRVDDEMVAKLRAMGLEVTVV